MLSSKNTTLTEDFEHRWQVLPRQRTDLFVHPDWLRVLCGVLCQTKWLIPDNSREHELLPAIESRFYSQFSVASFIRSEFSGCINVTLEEEERLMRDEEVNGYLDRPMLYQQCTQLGGFIDVIRWQFLRDSNAGTIRNGRLVSRRILVRRPFTFWRPW